MNHETSLFQPQAFAATIRRHSRRKQPRNRRRWTVFDRTSKRSFSVVRPPNRTSELDLRVRFQPVFESLFRPFPATFWGRSKNKSGSKYGVLPRIGVLNRDVEIFRRGFIALGTTRCQRVWRRVGSRMGTTVSPRMISQSSRARRISRILIRITFEPRTDLA
ncbi:unnamed protein product [Prunus armeniaca]